jgi:hypothetical protein
MTPKITDAYKQIRVLRRHGEIFAHNAENSLQKKTRAWWTYTIFAIVGLNTGRDLKITVTKEKLAFSGTGRYYTDAVPSPIAL